ncbi:hypothetical protein DFQ28_009760 [Apophysomyces sp. BC1034]|nr:hypothetical protein DFQ28_009760 [Apophysomyces sp. BC1034]
MTKDLEQIHHELMDIARECTKMYHRKYSENELRELQDKVQAIDEKYNQGIIDNRDKDNPRDDPYEHPGQAQIADVLLPFEMIIRN